MKQYKITVNGTLMIGSKKFTGGVTYPETAFENVDINILIGKKMAIEVDSIVLAEPIITSKNDPKFKLRLAIVTGVWKRPEIFELFAKKTKQLKHKEVDIVVIVAGSEGDKTRKQVEKHGFKYIEIPNQPLAHKMNCTTDLAGKYKCDYVLCVGSDDIITQPLFDFYVEEMKKGTDFVGTLDWYFYDTNTKKFAYWGGYTDRRRGHTCGAGRLLSSKLMNEFKWKPWDLEHSHVLDNSMQQKLTKIEHTSRIISLKKEGLIGLDVKSSTNMTPFELWENTSYIPATKELKLCVE